MPATSPILHLGPAKQSLRSSTITGKVHRRFPPGSISQLCRAQWGTASMPGKLWRGASRQKPTLLLCLPMYRLMGTSIV